MPLMNVFEPLFLLLLLITIGTLLTAGVLAVARSTARAGRLLKRRGDLHVRRNHGVRGATAAGVLDRRGSMLR
jgi:hypothetical protein